jgi:nucleoside-diphosphate-sugar epimerase
VDLKAFFEKEEPDYIFHLAAYGNMSNQKDVSMTVFANIVGAFNMLHESLSVPYKAFINFGSSSEYGKKVKAMNEDDHINPLSFYGASKGGATLLANAFRSQFKKPITTVRPFSVYGDGEAIFRFIPTAIKNIKQGTPFQLEPEAVHDWIYIDDFISALFLIMNNTNFDIVNVGTGRMHKNKEVVEMLEKILNKSAKYNKVEGLRVNDSEVWMADNTRLKALGFIVEHMLFSGLIKTVKSYE